MQNENLFRVEKGASEKEREREVYCLKKKFSQKSKKNKRDDAGHLRFR